MSKELLHSLKNIAVLMRVFEEFLVIPGNRVRSKAGSSPNPLKGSWKKCFVPLKSRLFFLLFFEIVEGGIEELYEMIHVKVVCFRRCKQVSARIEQNVVGLGIDIKP